MKYRELPETDISVSEIGFGMWTVSTGWWGTYTDDEAVALMHKAFDLGITTYDAADTYGNGRSEELIGKAFPAAAQRDQVQIATKVGYNFYDHGENRTGQRAIPQDFSADFIRRAVDQALLRLKTDRIDVLQLHNIQMPQVLDDDLWATMDELKQAGKIRAHGAALGPAIGWLYEGIECVKRRNPDVLQHIYNMLEEHPGLPIMDEGASKTTRYFIRVTHSSGMLEGKYTKDTTFPPTDHRSHRPRSWLLNGLKKIDTLKFLSGPERTLGQAALQWLLADQRIATCLPNIYDEDQIKEFAAAVDTPALRADELAKVDELWKENFGVEEAPMKFKGTMTPDEREAALAG